jgi:hypothetical protein
LAANPQCGDFDFRCAVQRNLSTCQRFFPVNNLMKRQDFPMPGIRKIDRKHSSMDARDRLIVALYAQLKAERETRETLEWAIRNGAVSREVLEAIAADPVPVVTSEDIASVEKIIALDERRSRSRGNG